MTPRWTFLQFPRDLPTYFAPPPPSPLTVGQPVAYLNWHDGVEMRAEIHTDRKMRNKAYVNSEVNKAAKVHTRMYT